MNVNTNQMEQYAEFLAEKSEEIVKLCKSLDESLTIAMQCMDQKSGKEAAARMSQNIQELRKNVPISEDAQHRLKKSRSYVIDALNSFRR